MIFFAVLFVVFLVLGLIARFPGVPAPFPALASWCDWICLLILGLVVFHGYLHGA